MAKIIELRKQILTLIKTGADRVYYEEAPDNATFPYVVFSFPNSTDDGTLENFVLDIDFWDDDINTTALETLADTVDGKLHRKTIYVADTVNAILYRENRLSLVDDDPRLRRRKYVYQARTYC